MKYNFFFFQITNDFLKLDQFCGDVNILLEYYDALSKKINREFGTKNGKENVFIKFLKMESLKRKMSKHIIHFRFQ